MIGSEIRNREKRTSTITVDVSNALKTKLLLPVMILLKLIEWIGIFLITPLSVLLNLLSWEY